MSADRSAAARSAAGRRGVRVGLSTSSVFPEPAVRAFEIAERLGYDGVEVLVTAERVTQDAAALRALSEQYGIPVLSVHSPCLIVTARVWGTDPIGKLRKSVEMAAALGAGTVVVHPPFVWQRAAAGAFGGELRALEAARRAGVESAAGAGGSGSARGSAPGGSGTWGGSGPGGSGSALGSAPGGSGVRVAVENMFPTKVMRTVVNGYRPHWNPVPAGYPWYTLDFSHCAASGVDAAEMARAMGERLAHVHLTDGSGAMRDEHLLPGHGITRCGPVLQELTASGFSGAVVIEVSTQRSSAAVREQQLAEALDFAREHSG